MKKKGLKKSKRFPGKAAVRKLWGGGEENRAKKRLGNCSRLQEGFKPNVTKKNGERALTPKGEGGGSNN